jgi:hypothetical protein
MNGSRRPAFNSKIPGLVVSFVPAVVVATSIFAMVYWGWVERDSCLSNRHLGVGGRPGLVGAGCLPRHTSWNLGDRVGLYCAALVTFGVFGYYARQASNESISHEASFWIQEASFWTIQWLMVSLRRAAVRTSRFALALPSFLFVLVTSFSWAGLFSVGQEINDPFFTQEVLSHADGISRAARPQMVSTGWRILRCIPKCLQWLKAFEIVKLGNPCARDRRRIPAHVCNG